MPLYETVLQEKPPVIFEIGNAYTRVGFSGEAYPRFIIPSQIDETKSILEFDGLTGLYDQLVEFFQIIFFKHLLVSPKERKITLVESVFCTGEIRNTLAKVLFSHFEVSSLLFVPSHLSALTSLAVETALVVDLGFKETTIVPVYSGVQVIKAFQAQSYGSKSIHTEIRKKLKNIGLVANLSEKIIEDIKVRLCFVTTIERAKLIRNGSLNCCPDVEYSLNGEDIIKIPGRLRETAMEVFFRKDNENAGLPFIVLDALLACPIDMRADLAQNIVLIGGNAMVQGLQARLKSEIVALSSSAYYKERLFTKSIKFHKSMIKLNFVSWLGGSITGGTDLVLTKSFSKENYFRSKKVPDWCCIDNV